MKILNLYAGIGGNRKLWTPNGNEHEITAVELNPEIAAVYQEFYPNDIVIVADAHEYLLEHYKEFDFIWASPPCPSHSEIRRCVVYKGQVSALYPDMSLYQEIILLGYFSKCPYVVENVKPYYTPLIDAPLIGRHLFWSNFLILPFNKKDNRIHNDIKVDSTVYGVSLVGKNIEKKVRLLRNMVNPELGKHILDCAMGAEIKTEEQELF